MSKYSNNQEALQAFKDGTFETEVSKTFCALPWIHLSTKPNGHLRLCCNANSSSASKDVNEYVAGASVGTIVDQDGTPASLAKVSIEEAWNNEFMRSTRRAMLEGTIPRSCTKCFEEERNKIVSKRVWETVYWGQRLDLPSIARATRADGSLDPKVYYFDLRLGNLCNLQCAMCSPHDSSAWASKWHKIKLHSRSDFVKAYSNGWHPANTNIEGVYDWYKNPQFIEEFYKQLPHVRQLYFAGGEPFLNKEHFRILEKCVELGYAPNIELRYNTNLTVLPDHLFVTWKHFKSVKVTASIDGFDKVNHYVRYPTNWKTIEENLDKLDNTDSHITVTLACCINALNVLNFDDFIKWKIQKNYKKVNVWPNAAGIINWHLVYMPSILNIRVLPLEQKKLVKTRIEELKTWLLSNYRSDQQFINDPWGFDKLDGLINYMFAEDWSNKLQDTRDFIIGIDTERGINIEDHIPELAFIKQLPDTQ